MSEHDHAEPVPDPPPVFSHVSFGTGPTQVMPIQWANLFLAILHREHPQIFGKVLVQVVGAELPGRTRGRAGA
jgi:hypothetical protein